MKRVWPCALMLMVALLGCSQAEPEPTATVSVGQAAVPTATVLQATAFPTIEALAPEETFAQVGSKAVLSDGADGHAVLAGLQTLIIRSFSFDGKDRQADIRLILAGSPGDAAAVLFEIEPRIYADEIIVLEVPQGLTRSDVDAIAVYDLETEQVIAQGVFE